MEAITRPVFNALLACSVVLLCGSPGAPAIAAPGNLANTPLFVASPGKPNVILAIDDSGSMDFEVLFDTNDGALWWNTQDQSFVGRDRNDNTALGAINFNKDGESDTTWRKYVYIFPNGVATGNPYSQDFTGRRLYLDSSSTDDAAVAHAIPPLPEYAFARSGDYNKAYYDPMIDYTPWQSSSVTFSDQPANNARWDPVFQTFSSDDTINLITDKSDSRSGWKFYLYPGMRDSAGGNVVTEGEYDFSYYPATYYHRVEGRTYEYDGIEHSCPSPDNPQPQRYTEFANNPKQLEASKPPGADKIHALGPDGGCLIRYEIKSTNTTYPSGRTYAAEVQNFANWFTYNRRRYLAVKGGIGKAFYTATGVRASAFRINDIVDPSEPYDIKTTGLPDLYMYDMSQERDTFLSEVYNPPRTVRAGTPNRQAAWYMGSQLERTDSDAPINSACQQNYGVLFTDGYSSPYTNVGAGNADSAEGAPYQDSYSNTIADVAMYFYNKKLRSDFSSDLVPVPTGCSAGSPDPALDCNRNLHMNFYPVTLNGNGFIFDNQTYAAVADAYANPPTWTEPSDDKSPVQIDDLYHAAINGRGEMLNASTPADIEAQLASILKSAEEVEGAASAVSFSVSQETGGSNYVFGSGFNAEFWSGELIAYELTSNNNGAPSLTTVWNAGSLIPSAGARTIITYNGSQGLAFTEANLSSLSAVQQADLATNLPPALTAADRINYLRGDRSNEGQDRFRERRISINNSGGSSPILGDIVHSNTLYVGRPENRWPNVAPFPDSTTTRYAKFVADNASRKPMIYAGANDGMLHGFEVTGSGGTVASGGTERLAYVPQHVFSDANGEGLHFLSQQSYTHRFYVDTPITVADAYMRTRTDSNDAWRTILLGGGRAGSQGLFALDITDPTQFDVANANDLVLWEFTANDDPDLGYTFSKPTVALMSNGRWAAAFGNGYNSNGSGKAVLFIVYLDGGLDNVWTPGTDYLKITLGTDGSPIDPNGLSTPQLIDLNGDRVPDRAYAGDLFGNLWAIDLQGNCDVSSPVAGCEASWGADYNGEPLFVTQDRYGNAQPITSRPAVSLHPFRTTINNEPNLLVLFGTGQYLVSNDLTSTDTQSFYGVWDDGSAIVFNTGDDRDTHLSKVLANDLDLDRKTDIRLPGRVGPEPENIYTGNIRGWYMDLPDPGERVVVNASTIGDYVFFNTLIPQNDCTGGASGWLMSVRIADGSRPREPVFDRNGDGVLGDDDRVVTTDNNNNPDGESTGDTNNPDEKFFSPGGQRIGDGAPNLSGFLKGYQFTPLSDKSINIRKTFVPNTDLQGRISWEELFKE